MSEQQVTCSYTRCNEVAIISLIFKGERFYLCRKHFDEIQNVLYKLAMQEGEVNIEDVLTKTRAGKLKISPKIEIIESKVRRGERSAEKYVVELVKKVKKTTKRRKKRKSKKK